VIILDPSTWDDITDLIYEILHKEGLISVKELREERLIDTVVSRLPEVNVQQEL
jgi:hypothetical protein